MKTRSLFNYHTHSHARTHSQSHTPIHTQHRSTAALSSVCSLSTLIIHRRRSLQVQFTRVQFISCSSSFSSPSHLFLFSLLPIASSGFIYFTNHKLRAVGVCHCMCGVRNGLLRPFKKITQHIKREYVLCWMQPAEAAGASTCRKPRKYLNIESVPTLSFYSFLSSI